jgi:hypothetical protein
MCFLPLVLKPKREKTCKLAGISFGLLDAEKTLRQILPVLNFLKQREHVMS